MDKKLRATLTECIREIETGGATVESCLEGHPEQAAELRGHLALWQTMITSPRVEPSPQGQRRGEEVLLRAVRADEPARGRMFLGRFAPAMSTAAAAVAAVVLLVGGVAGASAALGGPNFVESVASGIGISKASDTGKDHANDNAFEGADNAGQGTDNASDNASEGADNAGQGSDNAPDGAPQGPPAPPPGGGKP